MTEHPFPRPIAHLPAKLCLRVRICRFRFFLCYARQRLCVVFFCQFAKPIVREANPVNPVAYIRTKIALLGVARECLVIFWCNVACSSDIE